MRASPPRVLSVADFQTLSATERHAVLIDIAYRFCLRRAPEPDMLAARVAGLDDGIAFADMFVEIATSPEALANASGADLAEGCSDGEFLTIVGRLLNGRGLVPAEIASGQRFLDGDATLRTVYVKGFLNDHVAARRDAKPATRAHDAGRCRILGTDRILTRDLWDQRAAALPARGPARRTAAAVPRSPSGSPKVSMIASLYRGRRFVESFLHNITTQTLFDQSELIIVDAASPEGEHEVIADYQKNHPNIVYERINYRIGIYDAWNRGVQMSRGAYLTNTNFDDLRREDSIALQADLLDRRTDVDVAYQDFFYSFDPDLDFEEVAAFGFQSELPIITPHNLLAFNSPHNAPMWRRSLHDDLGLFDTSYRSAGDYEFWLRCIANGKRFGKINTPHVVYFHNPEGISTSQDTRGLEESYRILSRYSEELTSTILLQSRGDFCASLGIDEPRGSDEPFRPYYDLLQGELVRCGEGRFADAHGEAAWGPRDARVAGAP